MRHRLCMTYTQLRSPLAADRTSELTHSLHSHFLGSFSRLANPSKLTLTTLSSRPKRITSLFPHSTSHPKCFQIDYLVTVGCDASSNTVDDPAKLSSSAKATEADSEETSQKNIDTTGSTLSDSRPKPDPAARTILTSALSAHLYLLPTHSTSILYISKLDSSGYPTTSNLPLTRTLITSFLQFFTGPTRLTQHVRVHLFARSQGQYLFPNSAQGPKRVLGGLGLCGWWKGVYEEVAGEVEKINRRVNVKGKEVDVRLSYILPGYSGDEARGMLGQKRPMPEGLIWKYTPPFWEPLPPSSVATTSSSLAVPGTSGPTEPSGPSATSSFSIRPTPALTLANLIPSFPDDPKSRFLDEITLDDTRHHHTSSSAAVAAVQDQAISNSPKKRKEHSAKSRHRHQYHEQDEEDRRLAEAALRKVSKEEFWERMGFRQECISGDVTGFFSLSVSAVGEGDKAVAQIAQDAASRQATTTSSISTTPAGGSASASLGVAGSSEVSHETKSQVSAVLPTTTGDNEPTTTSSTPTPPTTGACTESSTTFEDHTRTATGTSITTVTNTNTASTRQHHPLPPELVDRLLTALTNTDFATAHLALEGSTLWSASVRNILLDQLGDPGDASLEGYIGVVEAKVDVGIGVAEGEKRKKAEESGGGGGVTVLQVRKKKKVAAVAAPPIPGA